MSVSRSIGPCLIGLAMGGFVDGIVFHQILQWHHLLSGVEDIGTLEQQILADGLFHAFMYVVAFTGLVLIWVRPTDTSRTQIAGDFLIGFGVWHIADAIISHWWLGLHHVRMDVLNPAYWDIALFSAGVVTTLIGVALARSGGSPSGRMTRAVVSIAILVAATWAAWPPPPTSRQPLAFLPGVTAEQAFVRIAAVNARPIWSSRDGSLWVVDFEQVFDVTAPDGAVRLGRLQMLANCSPWTTLATR